MNLATTRAAIVVAITLLPAPCTVAAAPPASAPDAVVAPPDRSTLRFGESIAACGDLAAIGSPVDGDLGAEEGSAHVVQLGVRADGSWSCEHVARLGSGAKGDHFGAAVAITRAAGRRETVAVGADRASVRTGFEGAVYLFSSADPQSVLSRTRIAAPRPQAGAEFGSAVALDDSAAFLAVGARREDIGAAPDAGCVHVYRESASPASEGGLAAAADPSDAPWLHVQSLAAPEPSMSAWFGHAVALSGSWLAVGAPGARIGETAGAGCVYLYAHLEDGSFVLAATLASPARASHAWFGHALAIDGSTLVVGEPRAANNGVRGGAAWVFDLDAIDEPPLALRAPQAAAAAMSGIAFGQSVAIDSRAILVGAPGFDEAIGGTILEDTGRVFAFARAARGPGATHALRGSVATPMTLCGASTALARVPRRDRLGSGIAALAGHLFVEEESLAPSPGVAVYALDELTPALARPDRADTTSQASASSP